MQSEGGVGYLSFAPCRYNGGLSFVGWEVSMRLAERTRGSESRYTTLRNARMFVTMPVILAELAVFDAHGTHAA